MRSCCSSAVVCLENLFQARCFGGHRDGGQESCNVCFSSLVQVAWQGLDSLCACTGLKQCNQSDRQTHALAGRNIGPRGRLTCMRATGSSSSEPQWAMTIFMSFSMLGNLPLLLRIRKSRTCAPPSSIDTAAVRWHACDHATGQLHRYQPFAALASTRMDSGRPVGKQAQPAELAVQQIKL